MLHAIELKLRHALGLLRHRLFCDCNCVAFATSDVLYLEVREWLKVTELTFDMSDVGFRFREIKTSFYPSVKDLTTKHPLTAGLRNLGRLRIVMDEHDRATRKFLQRLKTEQNRTHRRSAILVSGTKHHLKRIEDNQLYFSAYDLMMKRFQVWFGSEIELLSTNHIHRYGTRELHGDSTWSYIDLPTKFFGHSDPPHPFA